MGGYVDLGYKCISSLGSVSCCVVGVVLNGHFNCYPIHACIARPKDNSFMLLFACFDGLKGKVSKGCIIV